MQHDEFNIFQSKSDLPNLLNLYRAKIENSGVEFSMSHRVALPFLCKTSCNKCGDLSIFNFLVAERTLKHSRNA